METSTSGLICELWGSVLNTPVILASPSPWSVSTCRDLPTGFSSPKNLLATTSETTQVNGSISAVDGSPPSISKENTLKIFESANMTLSSTNSISPFLNGMGEVKDSLTASSISGYLEASSSASLYGPTAWLNDSPLGLV